MTTRKAPLTPQQKLALGHKLTKAERTKLIDEQRKAIAGLKKATTIMGTTWYQANLAHRKAMLKKLGVRS
jgi:hypothetical protein